MPFPSTCTVALKRHLRIVQENGTCHEFRCGVTLTWILDGWLVGSYCLSLMTELEFDWNLHTLVASGMSLHSIFIVHFTVLRQAACPPGRKAKR